MSSRAGVPRPNEGSDTEKFKNYNDAKVYFEKQIEMANQLGHEQAIEETGIMLARTYRMLFKEASGNKKNNSK